MKTYKTLRELAQDIGVCELTAKRWKKAGKVIKGTRIVESEEKCYYLSE